MLMDTNKLHLVLVSPEKTLYDGLVNSVELPGEMGRFQVLFNHAALISSLQKGNVVFEIGEAHNPVKRDTQTISIQSGFVEIKDNLVSVCVEQ